MRVFHGWWIVAACMLAALFGNALGLFGAGVYLHEVVKANGWTTGLVSGAVTLFYMVSALLLIPVGMIFGLTVGNVTTLSPIIVRREFGAREFGTVFGVASCGIQLMTALGPSFYDLLYDDFGSYGPALTIAAVLDIAAAMIAILGHRKAAAALA
jgi:cyanate permease